MQEYGQGSAGPQFHPHEEPHNAGIRWRQWVRNFQYYIDGQFSVTAAQKVARLLHQAGPDVQEIYETLKSTEAIGNDEYEKALVRLESYFIPETNIAYERQSFRSANWHTTETSGQFALKLRTKARNCQFTDTEDRIRDQIVEKCNDKEIKRKLIRKGSELTLKGALDICKSFEIERIQNKEEIVAVDRIRTQQKPLKCYRCGSSKHLARDESCPAQKQNCTKCGLKGHFYKQCKTKKKGKRYVKYIVQESTSSDSSFSEDDSNASESDEVQMVCKIDSAQDNSKYASPVGVAAVLIQQQVINGQQQPIVIKYISKALTQTEQKYSQTEKEALAIVWACESLYMYLIGKDFAIISDHKPLEVIYSAKSKTSARIQRWVLRLQPFTFKVIYKPGKSNIADPLSRLLNTDNKPENIRIDFDEQLLASIETTTETISLEQIRDASLQDEELLKVIDAMEKDTWSKELRKYELIKMELCIVQDIILRGSRIVIPKKLIPKVLELGHEGHIGANGMKAKLRSKVWWITMDKDIEYWNDTCEGCRLVRRHSPPEPILSTDLPNKVWQQVAIDYLGPLPSGHYLFFIIDYYSRYYEVEITKNPTSENTIKFLKTIMAREGIMDTLVCDNGPAFRDQKFIQFLSSNGIRLRHTTPLWPQANGEVERQNRSVLRRLRIAQSMKLDWKEELLTYLAAYRTTPHSTTNVPPGNLFRGRNIKTRIPEISLDNEQQNEEIRDVDRYRKNRSKVYADCRRHAKPCDLELGDKVLIRQRKENKLSTPYSPEEHTIIQKSGSAITAQTPEGKQVTRNSSYFQKIKERDLSEVGRRREHDRDKEGSNEGSSQEQTANDATSLEHRDTFTPDLTKPAVNNDMTMTKALTPLRPQRDRRAPLKYNDFLLGLVIDTDRILQCRLY